MTTNNRDEALRFLYKNLWESKTALSRAETRPGVTAEELANLQKKIDVIDWIVPLVIKAEEE